MAGRWNSDLARRVSIYRLHQRRDHQRRRYRPSERFAQRSFAGFAAEHLQMVRPLRVRAATPVHLRGYGPQHAVRTSAQESGFLSCEGFLDYGDEETPTPLRVL